MRVSSESDRQSFDLQYDALIQAGVDPRHIYQDRASGAKDQRNGLKKALEFVMPGDCLVVWKLDRLGRSLSHLITIIESLKEKGKEQFLFSVFGALAQYERALTKERIMAGFLPLKNGEKQDVVLKLFQRKKCKQF